MCYVNMYILLHTLPAFLIHNSCGWRRIHGIGSWLVVFTTVFKGGLDFQGHKVYNPNYFKGLQFHVLQRSWASLEMESDHEI